jgi:hypothetical protein
MRPISASDRATNTARRQELLNQLGNVTELESDYLGMSSYYYNSEQDRIYEIVNVGNVRIEIPSPDVNKHLREINHLP